jgi:hypothetical protein
MFAGGYFMNHLLSIVHCRRSLSPPARTPRAGFKKCSPRASATRTHGGPTAAPWRILSPHAMPCHHDQGPNLTAYIEGAGLAGDPKGPLFATIGGTANSAATRPPFAPLTPSAKAATNPRPGRVLPEASRQRHSLRSQRVSNGRSGGRSRPSAYFAISSPTAWTARQYRR